MKRTLFLTSILFIVFNTKTIAALGSGESKSNIENVSENFYYSCKPMKSNKSPFLEHGATLNVAGDSLDFIQFIDSSDTNAKQILRHYRYKLVGEVRGSGRNKGMMKYKITEYVVNYGDAISEIFIDKELLFGGYELYAGGLGGRFTFAGHGYSWDWNLCKLIDADFEIANSTQTLLKSP